MKKSKFSFATPLLTAVAMVVGLLLGNLFTPKNETQPSMGQSRYQKIQDIIQILDRKYVDEVNSEEIFEKAIADMLHNLDPHSNYIPAKDLKAINEQIEGKFGGVGIRFFIIRDTVCVTNVIKDSPSMRAGLAAGDKILKVDGEDVAGKSITNDEIMGMLKGREGTTVKLVLLRDGKKISKTVQRGTIPVESVLASYMIDDEIGYIKIERFSVETAHEFRVASRALKQKGMKKMIIDLRNNGGGVLTSATEIADEFLGPNIPIVETRGQHTGKYVYYSTSRGSLKEVDLVILINANSASASEILAGAIQDNDRGIIVGRRSFGKGLVQEDVPLRDGSNLRLTVARYYTPTGRCIQKPYDGDIEEYYNDTERYDNGELYAPDSSLFVDSLKYTTPGGKVVYGGGGIMPDEFVAYDSTGTSWYYTHLRFSAAFTSFAFDHVSDKRNKWQSVDEYIRSFVVTDKIINSLANFAEKEYKVTKDAAELARSKDRIKQQLKAEIARQLWIEQGYYRVNNLSDNEILEAIKVLK